MMANPMIKLIVLAVGLLLVGLAALLLWMAKGIQSPRSSTIEAYQTKASTDPHTRTSTMATKLSIMSWNIAWAYGQGSEGHGKKKSEEQIRANLDRIAESIINSQADVVLLQEVDFNSHRSYRINQASYLAKKIGHPFVSEAVSWSANYLPFPYWPPSEHWKAMRSGGAILSRIPLENCRMQLLSKPKSQSFVYRLFYLFRYLQACDLQFEGKTVTIYNTHLEAFDLSNREQQMKAVVEIMKNDNAQHSIFGGDFNTVPAGAKKRHDYPDEPETDHRQDRTLQILSDAMELKNSGTLKPPSQEADLFTFPAHAPNRKLDHIFVDDSWAVRSLIAPNSAPEASDHLPLLMRLSVK